MASADIHLWTRQHTEHALFMTMGLVEKQPRAYAEHLHRAWSRLLASKTTSAQAILPILDETHAFETRLYDATTRGAWLGWLSPDFYHHIREEAVYFRQLLTVPPTPRAELWIWIDLLADHAVALGSLVDPMKRAVIGEGFALADAVRAIDKLSFTRRTTSAADRASEEVDRFLRKTAKVPSVIPPALRAHALREDAWFRRILRERIEPSIAR